MNKLVQGHGSVAIAAIVVLVFVTSPASGTVYKVGESAGWTTIGNVDYKQWAATKSFRLGDVVVFQYNPQFHNVMQVNHAGYKSCNASSPIATHTTGNDTIIISKHGHYFFLCGVPGHCLSRQKVDIHVLKTINSTITPSSSIASLLAPAISPTPSNSASNLWNSSKRLVYVAGVGVASFLVGVPTHII